ncbi:nitroreductase family protein [Paenibacillus thermotolerans]|uniref:nitroreductase family protein n=1 Tax=Paenibacillus thermotolerans TaxID=3027807 RepID=UPI002367AD0E|nr:MULTISPECIES: nitroreductase family protein [unclassified Paenibacillus]
MSQPRKPTYEIDRVFIDRWSPRSFSDKTIPEEVLLSLFEAARWAPSGNNHQPWRFVIANTKESLERFHSFINPSNLVWCEKAPALTLVISKTTNHEDKPLRTHAFDTGAAWGYLALEAVNKGLVTHPMGGFDREKARSVLNIPPEYQLHIVVAIGYQGGIDDLPENLRDREQPNGRRELKESLYFGEFGRVQN